MTEDGGTAFPRILPDGVTHEPGMSLYDWYAGMALQGLLASELESCASISNNVKEAFDIADNMIKERAKRMA